MGIPMNAEARRFIEWTEREMRSDVERLLVAGNPCDQDGSARMMARAIARTAQEDPDNPAVAGLIGLARKHRRIGNASN